MDDDGFRMLPGATKDSLKTSATPLTGGICLYI
jgi:hypothetical protein